MGALSADDRQAITEMLSRYGLLIDQGRVDEWEAMFVGDAEFDVPGQEPLRTGPARRAMVEGAPRGLHLCAPPVIRSDGPDGTATTEQSFLFRNLETGQMLTGWYEDTLVKREAQWLFASRRIQYFRRPRPGAVAQ